MRFLTLDALNDSRLCFELIVLNVPYKNFDNALSRLDQGVMKDKPDKEATRWRV